MTLYDSLRELEGEFLVKYMQNMEPELSEEESVDATPTIGTTQEERITIEEPAGWSMSFGSSGLCLQAVTRNLFEYRTFIISISQQLIKGFGMDYLPKLWDPDAEGYHSEEDMEEELDEDEYLVKIPAVPISQLLKSMEIETAIKKDKMNDRVIQRFLQLHLPHMIQHVESREFNKENGRYDHLVTIMQQLVPLLKERQLPKEVYELCMITSYIVSIQLLAKPTTTSSEVTTPAPLPFSIWQDCINYLCLEMIELVLKRADKIPHKPVCLCLLLLAWYQVDVNKTRNDVLIDLGIRLLYEDCDVSSELKVMMIHLDMYSSIFQSRTSCAFELWSTIDRKDQFREIGSIVMLYKVIRLLYSTTQLEEERKIDVDEILTIIKEVEIQEQQGQVNMIHWVTKLLLFRPFTLINQEEQTLTKTTFLDMSLVAADRLSICLSREHMSDYWIKTSKYLIEDVGCRIKEIFIQDQQVIEQVDSILNKIML